MLALSISGLVAAYILIAVLLLGLNLYSSWPWQVKAGTIVLTTIFYIVTYVSFPPLLGWPTAASPPHNFRLLATHVQQPDKIIGDEGAIYLWLTQTQDLRSATPPRAYKFPYSNGLYEKIVMANAKLHKGIALLGELDETKMVQVEDAGKKGQKSINIQFYELPDPLIPDK